MISPSLFLTSFKTFFKRSSNSPLYLAPAIKDAISSSQIVLFFRLLGRSPLTIRSARPSTMAVFPTPGSPIKTGLFLVFRDKTRVMLRISSSLPMTGSILPSLALSVILRPYFSRTFSSSLLLNIISPLIVNYSTILALVNREC